MRNLFKIIPLIGIIAALLFVLSACDGGFSGTGKVYEWKNPPSGEKGQIYIGAAIPLDISNFSPVPNAAITFYDKEGGQGQFEQNNYLDRTTNARGEFDSGSVVAPGTYPMKITVSKPGYYPLEKEFAHKNASTSVNFTILLVRIP